MTIAEEDQDRSDICIYTGGSGYEGKVGAGAVLYCRGAQKGKLRYRLGGLMEHTVYIGSDARGRASSEGGKH
jgi:hypothetical protein